MLTTPIMGMEYHRIHSEELMRSFRPTAHRWEHREKGKK